MTQQEITKAENQIAKAKFDLVKLETQSKIVNYNKNYAGKVYSFVQKWDKRLKIVEYIWWKSFSEKHGKIEADCEVLTFQFRKGNRKTDWQMSSLKHEKPYFSPPLPDKRIEQVATYHHILISEISVDGFKNLAKYIQLSAENIIDNVQNIESLEWVERQGDYSNSKAVEKSSKLLDVPHILVSSDDAFIIRNCIFLNQNVLLATKGCIEYLEQRIEEETHWDRFAGEACLTTGERNRNKSKVSRLNDLILMVKNNIT